MGDIDRISFRGIGRTSLEAVRRRWWLILPLLAAHWGLDTVLEANAAALFSHIANVDYFRLVDDVAGDLLTALAGAAIIGVCLTGGRREPLRPGRLLLSLLVALPTILLAEVAASGPGWLRNQFLRLDEGEIGQLVLGGGLLLLWLVYLVALVALAGTTVPLAIDRRCSPLTAIRGAFALTARRRRRLVWMALSLGLIDMIAAAALTLPFMAAGLTDHWTSNGGLYLLTGFNAVVLAALYLELKRLTEGGPERTAETFA